MLGKAALALEGIEIVSGVTAEMGPHPLCEREGLTTARLLLHRLHHAQQGHVVKPVQPPYIVGSHAPQVHVTSHV
jgi:hypothetical protein